MMDRLTERIEKYIEAYQLPPFGREVDGTVELLQEVSNKLAEYENLEKQGLLLRLPCKVGDTVYALRYGEENDFIVVETKIIEIRQNINGTFFEPLISRKAYKTEDFGKEVFLTKSEAEKKLKEMEIKN